MACRKAKAKRELIRVVRNADGTLVIDITGKKAGRGAYICRALACWQAGLKAGPLEHALKSRVALDNRDKLLEEVDQLLKGAS